ncbi:hypothetical protein [Paraherbaspirillum soli]|uniref:DUF262 domain-containing protein n=1 Tax=Paraherbaspirillum soli TaxID=631222 RepID=A0ABW0MFJ6_9BURK
MAHPLLILEDKNTRCASLLATIELGAYLDLVEKAYSEQGGLSGQRAPIRTKTALKIRNRLVQDLKNGAVIPPVVVGVVCGVTLKRKLKSLKTSEELVMLLEKNGLDLSIIDGMQRTTALREAFDTNNQSHFIRVEIWAAEKVSSLIYRMLVLNTGQVPWDLKRQLDTLYRPIISEVQKQLPGVQIIGLDETNRRSQAGEYRSTRVVELFLAFTSRSIDIDIKEKVAEEFIKIDLTEATSSDEFLPLFIRALDLMAKLDEQFDRIKQNSEGKTRVKNGKDIFTSSPGSIGFVVAVAELVLGAPGFDYDLISAKKNLEKIERIVKSLTKFIQKLDVPEFIEFVDLETLNQMLSVQSGKVGDHDRNLYKRAFITLLKRSKEIMVQGTMTPCWMSR